MVSLRIVTLLVQEEQIQMNDQWNHDFISDRIITANKFSIREFDNFTAAIEECDIPIFCDMRYMWDLKFIINENNKLTWEAIEYENGYDDHGMYVMSGHIKVITTPNRTDTRYLDECEDAFEFIQTLFPSKVNQVSDRNVFEADGNIYDFDNMTCNNGFIDFEFVLDK